MCNHLPIEAFLQILIAVSFFILIIILMIMYLNGYWSLEQRKCRWNRTHFTDGNNVKILVDSFSKECRIGVKREESLSQNRE